MTLTLPRRTLRTGIRSARPSAERPCPPCDQVQRMLPASGSRSTTAEYGLSAALSERGNLRQAAFRAPDSVAAKRPNTINTPESAGPSMLNSVHRTVGHPSGGSGGGPIDHVSSPDPISAPPTHIEVFAGRLVHADEAAAVNSKIWRTVRRCGASSPTSTLEGIQRAPPRRRSSGAHVRSRLMPAPG